MVAEMTVITLAILVFCAWLVRRLLGIRAGDWGRTIGAVLVGQSLVIGILFLVVGRVFELPWYWYPIGCALVVVLSMMTLAMFELAAGRSRQPRPLKMPHPVKALRRRLGHFRRYLRVAGIALRNGLLGTLGDDPASRGPALGRALAATFEEAGGLFVKLGQAMASQPQLVTPAVALELARLQDQAAPSDPQAALAVLREEIGAVEEVFEDFDATPVATASIGQTYFATLRGGSPVVVKVQRPGIGEVVERDLEIITQLAERLEKRAAWARALGITELVAGFVESTREELDYRIEAENNHDTVQAIRESDLLTVPAVVQEFTTARVMVQERVMGRSIGTPGILEGMSAVDRRRLADSLLSVIAGQMLDGGRFHADPHPGNVFLTAGGRLALIDFGSVGRLNRFERQGLLDLFRGLQDEDPTLVRQAALRLGTAVGRIDTEALDRELARLLSKALLPGDRLDPAAVGEIVVVFRDFGIRLPRSITALFRTLFTLMGTLEVLHPAYDLIGGVRRLGVQLANPLRQYGSFTDFVQHEAMTLGPVLSRLPGDVDELTRSLLRGDVRLRVSLLSEPEDVSVIWRMLNRAVLSGISAVLVIGSAILLTVRDGSEAEIVLSTIGGIGLTFGSLLLLRMILQILQEGD